VGLDFSIEVKIKHKRTKETFTIEAAYWRKCYGIRDEVMDAALLSDKVLKYDEDYLLVVKPKTIADIIKRLCDVINDEDVMKDSIWGTVHTQLITLEQLKSLYLWQSFIDSFSSDYGCVDDDVIDGLNERISLYNETYGANININLADVLTYKADYDICLEINNSY
jgi:hypothetical protein